MAVNEDNCDTKYVFSFHSKECITVLLLLSLLLLLYLCKFHSTKRGIDPNIQYSTVKRMTFIMEYCN